MKPEVLIEMARDWANIKRRQACDILGTPEASELLADAKKFDLLVDALRLPARIEASLDDIAGDTREIFGEGVGHYNAGVDAMLGAVKRFISKERT